jgi:hypothetical protein
VDSTEVIALRMSPDFARSKRIRTPAPAEVTCWASIDWSSRIGATTSGSPADSASHTVLCPPWHTTADACANTATWGIRRASPTFSLTR